MRIALLSTSDTDLLSARASEADYLVANPGRPAHTSMAQTIEGCDLVVGRILGSPQDLCSGFTRIRATGIPVVVLGGEQIPNAELMELSSVPIGVAAQAHCYLAEGGPANLAELHAFRSRTGFPDLVGGRWRREATKPSPGCPSLSVPVRPCPALSPTEAATDRLRGPPDQSWAGRSSRDGPVAPSGSRDLEATPCR